MDEKKLRSCPFCGCKLKVQENFGYVNCACYVHPYNDCFLAKADADYGAVWFPVHDEEMIDGWERRTDNG